MENKKRLIDANDLKKIQTVLWDEALGFSNCVLVEDIDNAPEVEAVEVVHAEWLDIQFDSMWRSAKATCSHCRVRGEVRLKRNECGFEVLDSEYCPKCGAKMDGERKDNEHL